MSKVYCGIDYHKRNSVICFLDSNGHQSIKKVSSDHLIKELVNKDNLLIGVEASGGVNHLVDQLKRHNLQVKIINSNKFRGIGIGGKKTDEKDAFALAHCLKVDFIPEVTHKSLGSRRIKSLLRIREQFVNSRVRLTNHVRGILREYGIKINVGADEFWNSIGSKLDELDFEPIARNLRGAVFEAKALSRKTLETESDLRNLLKDDPRFNNLMTVPGIGLLTAAAFIAVGDDFSRFKDSKTFASYLGLVPRENSSGDKKRMGSVTKSGQEILRRYLIHGARSVLRYTNDSSKEPIRVWALKLKKSKGMCKATVALAHKLARIGFRVVMEDRIYRK